MRSPDAGHGAHDPAPGRDHLRLDPELVAEILNIVRDGMTILMATDEMGFAREVSSRVYFSESGLVHEQGSRERIFKEPESERTRLFLRRTIEAGRL